LSTANPQLNGFWLTIEKSDERREDTASTGSSPGGECPGHLVRAKNVTHRRQKNQLIHLGAGPLSVAIVLRNCLVIA
jgi:hypothetical protein